MTFYISSMPRLFRSLALVLFLMTLVAGLTLTDPTRAKAGERELPQTTDIAMPTPQQILELATALDASKIPRVTTGGVSTYTFDNGVKLSYEEAVPQSRLGGGKESNGQFYISFNQMDQDFLMAGIGIGLTVAICSVPVVGTIACGVAGAIVTLAMVVIAHNGKCKGNKQLIVHVNPSWSTCR